MGAGLMGEQGAESLHSAIHNMDHRYSSIVNRLDRLKYIVKEHNILTAPSLNTLRPTPNTAFTLGRVSPARVELEREPGRAPVYT